PCLMTAASPRMPSTCPQQVVPRGHRRHQNLGQRHQQSGANTRSGARKRGDRPPAQLVLLDARYIPSSACSSAPRASPPTCFLEPETSPVAVWHHCLLTP